MLHSIQIGNMPGKDLQKKSHRAWMENNSSLHLRVVERVSSDRTGHFEAHSKSPMIERDAAGSSRALRLLGVMMNDDKRATGSQKLRRFAWIVMPYRCRLPIA